MKENMVIDTELCRDNMCGVNNHRSSYPFVVGNTCNKEEKM
jgi:hypothetical protein